MPKIEELKKENMEAWPEEGTIPPRMFLKSVLRRKQDYVCGIGGGRPVMSHEKCQPDTKLGFGGRKRN